jgi:uncharacterized protein YecT (DUF1311 family)
LESADNEYKVLFAFDTTLIVIPAGAISSPTAPRDYAHFELTNAEEIAVARVTMANCPKKSGGPKYQAKCREKLVAQSDARLNASYQRAMARLSSSNREALRTEERSCIQERQNECLAADERQNDISGTTGDVPLTDCILLELKRRTIWLERYSIGG